MAVDKALYALKNKIAVSFSRYLISLQKGYLLHDNVKIINAITAVEYMSDYILSDEEKMNIIEFHMSNLENAG